MRDATGTVTFAMTGVLHRNGRAIRQIRVLQQVAERVEVVAGDAERCRHLFPENVRLHSYAYSTRTGVRFFREIDRATRRVIDRLETDVYHASDLYVLPAMASAARKGGKRLVYDARELYPFVQGTVGKPWATLFWSRVEGRYVRRADLILTVNDSIADRIEGAYGVNRPVVVHNVPDRIEVHPSDHIRRTIRIEPTTLVVLHLGHLRSGRGGEVLVRAMKHVEGAVLVFVGSGPEEGRLAETARSDGSDSKVFFFEPVPYDQVLDVAAGADVGVTLLEDTCLNHRLALPNKLFEYLAAGLPVIASDFPEIGRVVNEFDVGIAVDPSSVEQVAAAIQRMVDEPESRQHWARNTEAVTDTYSWTKASERMTRAYQALGIGATL